MIRNQAGVALVMVLWVTVLLTIMAGSFTQTVRRESALISNIKAKSQAGALAEAGIYYAMMMLLISDTEKQWKSNGLVYEFSLNEARIRVQIYEETGKVDLNYADQTILIKLFQSLELDQKTAESLTDAVMDWRDEDDMKRENGAEKRAYEEQGLYYGPSNGAFKMVEELQLVIGMNAQIYKRLEPLITVYSQSPEVNFNKAPEPILSALMENEDKVIEQMESRKTPTLIEQLSERDNDPIDIGEVTSQGSVFSVMAEAELPGLEKAHVFAVIRKNQNGLGFDFLRWKRNSNNTSLFGEQEEFVYAMSLVQ